MSLMLTVKDLLHLNLPDYPAPLPKTSGVPLLGFAQSCNKLFSSGSEGSQTNSQSVSMGAVLVLIGPDQPWRLLSKQSSES